MVHDQFFTDNVITFGTPFAVALRQIDRSACRTTGNLRRLVPFFRFAGRAYFYAFNPIDIVGSPFVSTPTTLQFESDFVPFGGLASGASRGMFHLFRPNVSAFVANEFVYFLVIPFE